MSFLAFLSDPFLQTALLAGLLVSLACGVVGTLVVVRRLTFITGGIAHAVLGGVGVAIYLNVAPLWGILVSGQIAALVLGTVSRRAKQYEEPIIAALWSVGMATGILLAAMSPGYQSDLMSYLFGNILLIAPADILGVALLDAVILLSVGLFYKALRLVCFDEEYAALRGIPTTLFYMLLLSLVALTVIGVMRVVGLIMVIALMSLPPTMMLRHTNRLSVMMLGSSLICAAMVTIGLCLSFWRDWPSGATIVLLTGLTFLLKMLADIVVEKLRRHPRN